MNAPIRATAAMLAPLIALAPSCAVPRREVRLQVEGGETLVHVAPDGGQPIEVPEVELWGSFRAAARELAVPVDPLAAAEETFGLAEASGTYWYFPRSGRLLPGPLGAGLEETEGAGEALTRGYLGWCGGTRLGGGDCLHLLRHSRVLPWHGRYVVTLVMAMTASFGPMLDRLKDFADPNAVAVTLATAAAVYLVLLLTPEPISKVVSIGITAGLVGYLGWDLFWSLVRGWRALAPKVEAATDFRQLREAADDFGKVLGPQMGQLLILLVSHSLGKGLAARGKAPPPRFAEAEAQAEKLTGVRLGAAGAAVRSVTLGAGILTISLASSAVVASGTSPDASTGPGGSKRSPMKNAPYQPLQNGDAVIEGRPYSGHALDQMRNRGLTPTIVENTIKTGIRTPDLVAGRMRFFDPTNNVSVVLEGERVITVVPGRLHP